MSCVVNENLSYAPWPQRTWVQSDPAHGASSSGFIPRRTHAPSDGLSLSETWMRWGSGWEVGVWVVTSSREAVPTTTSPHSPAPRSFWSTLALHLCYAPLRTPVFILRWHLLLLRSSLWWIKRANSNCQLLRKITYAECRREILDTPKLSSSQIRAVQKSILNQNRDFYLIWVDSQLPKMFFPLLSLVCLCMFTVQLFSGYNFLKYKNHIILHTLLTPTFLVHSRMD